jgi:integral membrane protein
MIVNFFRIISYLEGISLILLVFVGSPLKYLYNNDSWVKALGMPHGVLFIIYIFLAIVLRDRLKWDAKTFYIVILCAIIPFGTFYADRKYMNKLALKA